MNSVDAIEDDKPIWGAKNFAPHLNTSVRKTYNLIAKGRLAGAVTQVGKNYVSTPRRLREAILGRDGGDPANKGAL